MGSRKAKIVILCEDRQQSCFARYFLEQWGWEGRDFEPKIAELGKNGEQFVRERFPIELQAYRCRRNMGAEVRLVVIVDADTRTVDDRINALEMECCNKGIPFRDASDQVAFAVPKRNIETWIKQVMGNAPDETNKYPKLQFQSDCYEPVKAYSQACKLGIMKMENPPPPSLERACNEFRSRII